MKKPSCTWINKHLVPLSEKTLPPVQLEKIQKHLSQCPGCKKLTQDFSALWDQLAAQNEPAQRVSLWPGLALAINELPGKSQQTRGFYQRIPRQLRPIAAALGLVFALVTGWELGNPPIDSDTQFSPSGHTGSEEMYISEYLEPFSDLPVGSLADLYLDSDSPDKETNP